MHMYRVFKEKLKQFSSLIKPLCNILGQTIKLLSCTAIDIYNLYTFKQKLELVKSKIRSIESFISTKKDILLKFYQYYVNNMVPSNTQDNNVRTYSICLYGPIKKANQERLEELQIKSEGDLETLKGFITRYTDHIKDFDSKLNEPCACINEAIKNLEYVIEGVARNLIQCFLQNLTNHIINNNITTNWDRLTNNTTLSNINIVIKNLISRIVIIESISVVSRLHIYTKIKSEIDEIFQLLKHCPCYMFYDLIYKVGVKDIQLAEATHVNDNPHLKLPLKNKMVNDRNKLCLCLVVRYILLTDLYSIIRYNEYLDRDMLSCTSRNYQKYSYSATLNFNISKLIMLIITTLDKITLWMKKRFTGYKNCYCDNNEDPYYSYLISIILFVSSLVENIWTMDPETVRMCIEKLSEFISIINETDNIYIMDFIHYCVYTTSQYTC